jgi:hypothetical protein
MHDGVLEPSRENRPVRVGSPGDLKPNSLKNEPFLTLPKKIAGEALIVQ